MDLQNFLFLDESDTTGESNVLTCTNARQLTLSVEPAEGATINLTVKGQLDFNSDEYFDLGAISLADYEVYNPIDNGGVYAFILDGVGRVKVINEGTAGNCTVFGRLSD